MPPLQRNAARLLTTVNGKPYARPCDHEEPIVSKPNVLAGSRTPQIDDDPLSSEDEEPKYVAPGKVIPAPVAPYSRSNHRSRLPATRPVAETGGRGRTAPYAGADSQESETAAVESFEQAEAAGSSDDGQLFGGIAGSRKATRTTYTSSLYKRPRPKLEEHVNIHGTAKKRKASTSGGSKRKQSTETPAITKGFKRAPVIEVPHQAAVTKRKALKVPPGGFRLTADSSSQIEPPSQEFRYPSGAENVGIDSSSGSTNGRTATRTSRLITDTTPASRSALEVHDSLTADSQTRLDIDETESLSSHSSREFVDLFQNGKVAGMPEPQPYVATTTCPMCGIEVELSFLRQFREENTTDDRMNVRLQTQFCRAHKRRTAEHMWRDRRYPNIDWDNLDKRLAKHHSHVNAILDQRVTSYYRNQLEETLRNRMKTAVQGWNAGGQIVPIGYYGSKGTQMMTESILSQFSTKLRQLAVSDKLIAAVGVSGGVSGYVQAVLVPELALALVKEDMDVDAERAREVMTEGTDVGDLLNEEEEEDRRASHGRLAPPRTGNNVEDDEISPYD
ncbi:hypothetical protein LTR66_011225 [Elasticomyces elasticus]|nr:hypothetical protein LTR66_011225 [Elasticomyces elasticus]KAK4987931.1 hypothetical protein LTR50_004268 [Elasticomyces elasticus]KAK5007639.1 hypothetical protein LTR28_005028 [Elasticomyces elasticus]